MIHPNLARVLCVLLLPGTASIVEAGQLRSLFNGVNLDGWTQFGGQATYRVDDGAIVGTSDPLGSPNAFLATNQSFSDFILELEFKIYDIRFNSGVQIRSMRLPEHNNGRVFGYQVEIDPTDRAWSGGIYFEGGSLERSAGWLDDLSDNPDARDAFVLGDWNHFRIVADGRQIRTWINDVPAADFTDDHATAFMPSGFIGLQVHRVSTRDPLEVRWRNIMILEVPEPSALTLLILGAVSWFLLRTRSSRNFTNFGGGGWIT